jgi:prepilin-type N-terminal cleavage/methylation domain-containing protein
MLLSNRKVLILMTPHRNRRSAGFSLIEIAITIVILLSLLAYGIPKFQTVIYNYQLDAAVDTCTYAIQATRYRAVQMGYPYQIAINASNNTYQVLNDTTYPTSTTFANVGSSLPITPANVTISASNTIQFSPSGLVTALTGSSLTFTVSYQGHSKQITVSSYGQVNVQ